MVLPMALTTTTTSAPRAPRAGDVVGDRTDAVSVADRCPAELLHDEGHAANLLRGARAGAIRAAGRSVKTGVGCKSALPVH